MNRTVLLVGLLLITPLLIFLALSFRSDPTVIESPLIGKPAPSFTLEDLDGRVIGLEDLRGRPVVLNFWATWCQPCVVEHPVLLAGARHYAGQVEFLGVIYQDQPELIRGFFEQRGAWGPALIDPEVEVAIAYGVYGAPETFFIDADGIIVEKVTGLLDPTSLARIVDSLL
ncbi:MAG: redoxin domain-containing protein [Thermoanaerobaculia bacterium]